jgi:hypothetical protein
MSVECVTLEAVLAPADSRQEVNEIVRLLDALRKSPQRAAATRRAGSAETLLVRRVSADAVNARGEAWDLCCDGRAFMRATLVELSVILLRMPGVGQFDWEPAWEPAEASEVTANDGAQSEQRGAQAR